MNFETNAKVRFFFGLAPVLISRTKTKIFWPVRNMVTGHLVNWSLRQLVILLIFNEGTGATFCDRMRASLFRLRLGWLQ